jgi:phosphoglycolate phosphatase-like HAD superfamily hydrolase
MDIFKKRFLLLPVLCICLGSCTSPASKDDAAEEGIATADPLPSWNEGDTKQAIIDFIESTTTEGSRDYIPAADRISVFDNDGTLWSEQPLYFQLYFAIDRVKAMADAHPEWKTQEPFSSLLEGDMASVLEGGEHAILELVMASHAGMNTDEFSQAVGEWLATAKHPEADRPFTEMIYQPMLELLHYLRDHCFKTFIVSGGGIDFMRVWVEEAYGIPPDQVIGSSVKVKFETGDDGLPELVKLPEMNFIDDKEGKPVGIHQYIGKRPVFAAGNSDGDYQMLQWTTSAPVYPRLGMLIHHTDADREWAYDRNSHIGRLDRGLDDAEKYGWVVVDMKEAWSLVYTFEQPGE